MIKPLVVNGQPYYVMFVHPSMAEMLRPTPREKWRAEYRVQRMRAKGYTEEQINPFAAAGRKLRSQTWEGVRFIEGGAG